MGLAQSGRKTSCARETGVHPVIHGNMDVMDGWMGASVRYVQSLYQRQLPGAINNNPPSFSDRQCMNRHVAPAAQPKKGLIHFGRKKKKNFFD